MVVSSCDEDDPHYPEYDENIDIDSTDMGDLQIKLSMMFLNGQVFSVVVSNYISKTF